MSCHSLLACRVSAEKTADNFIGIPLYVIFCFYYLLFVFNFCQFDYCVPVCVPPWVNPVWQGSPTPRLQTSISPRPVRNRATQQEVSSRPVSEASSAAPHLSPSLALPPDHPPPPPHPHTWKNCLPQNWSLVPKRLGTAAVWDSLHLLDLGDCFLSQAREVFRYYLFKYFLRPFLYPSGPPLM